MRLEVVGEPAQLAGGEQGQDGLDPEDLTLPLLFDALRLLPCAVCHEQPPCVRPTRARTVVTSARHAVPGVRFRGQPGLPESGGIRRATLPPGESVTIVRVLFGLVQPWPAPTRGRRCAGPVAEIEPTRTAPLCATFRLVYLTAAGWGQYPHLGVLACGHPRGGNRPAGPRWRTHRPASPGSGSACSRHRFSSARTRTSGLNPSANKAL